MSLVERAARRREALKRYAGGERITDIARGYGVTWRTVYAWIERDRKGL